MKPPLHIAARNRRARERRVRAGITREGKVETAVPWIAPEVSGKTKRSGDFQSPKASNNNRGLEVPATEGSPDAR